MPNDTTPHFALPLPHPGNEGVDDCLRLRQALTDVDTALKSVADDVITKADAADINAALEGFSADMATVMEQKADTDTVNTALALKADKSTVALALEGVAAELALKSDATATTEALALKADKSTVLAALTLKADESAVTASLALKADAASNTADHDALLTEIAEAQASILTVDAKAQRALDRDPLPSMADAAGKFLSTDGTHARWQKLDTLAVVNPPTVTIPAQFPIGYAQTMRMSATSRLTDGHVASFLVLTGQDAAAPISVPALNNAADYDLTLSGTAGDLTPVTVVAVDNSGYQSDPVTHNVALVTPRISAPVLTFPDNNTTSAMPDVAVAVGPFSVSLPGFDAPKATNNFAYTYKKADGTVLESGHKTFAAQGGTLAPTADLPISTDITLETQWLGEKLESPMTTVRFTTLTAFIHAPEVTGITEGQTGVALVPTVNIGEFAVTPAGFDAPKATDNFAYSFKVGETVVDSGMKTFSADGGGITPATALPLESEVVFEGHWVGGKLTGASKSVGFVTTSAYVEKPVITLPSAGGTLRTANASVVTAPFASVGGPAHVSTDWKLTSDLAGNDIVQEALGSSDKLAHTFQHGFGPAFKLSEAGAWYWFGVTYGNGVWVAVGERGKTSTSPDGKAWTPIVTVSGMALHWRDVTYANGMFVAVGDGGRTSTSPDGKAWTPAVTVSGAGAWQAVIYANGLFVAVGQGGMTSTSPDGKAWTPAVTASGMNGEWWYGVTYGNGLFVVVGDGGKTSTSPDGKAWTPAVQVSGMNGEWYAVTYANGLFVAVGKGGITSTSPDGKAWTPAVQVSGQPSPWRGITYGNGKFVAVGDYGKTATSADGVTWTPVVAVSGQTSYWFAVAYGNGKFVAVGDGGLASIAQFLPIDQTVYCWAKHNSDIAVGEPWSVPVQATVKESCFVAVGAGGKTTTSTDGKEWTPAVAVSMMPGFTGIAYSNGKFVAVGETGKTTTSTDGVTWTTPVAVSGQAGAWISITYGNGKFVAGGEIGTMASSTDGVTWTPTVAVSGQSRNWYCVIYANGKFVAGGGFGKMTTSTDGVTWTTPVTVTGYSGNWESITYSIGKFVAAGMQGRMTTSTDGVTWTPDVEVNEISGSWMGITYGNGKFVAVGANGKTTTSTDGVTWTPAVAMSGITASWRGITYSNGKFVAVGDGGKTTTSTDGVTWTTPVAVSGQTGIWRGITYG